MLSHRCCHFVRIPCLFSGGFFFKQNLTAMAMGFLARDASVWCRNHWRTSAPATNRQENSTTKWVYPDHITVFVNHPPAHLFSLNSVSLSLSRLLVRAEGVAVSLCQASHSRSWLCHGLSGPATQLTHSFAAEWFADCTCNCSSFSSPQPPQPLLLLSLSSAPLFAGASRVHGGEQQTEEAGRSRHKLQVKGRPGMYPPQRHSPSLSPSPNIPLLPHHLVPSTTLGLLVR